MIVLARLQSNTLDCRVEKRPTAWSSIYFETYSETLTRPGTAHFSILHSSSLGYKLDKLDTDTSQQGEILLDISVLDFPNIRCYKALLAMVPKSLL